MRAINPFAYSPFVIIESLRLYAHPSSLILAVTTYAFNSRYWNRMFDLFYFVLLPSNRRENVLDYTTFCLFACLCAFQGSVRLQKSFMLLECTHMKLVAAVSLQKTSGHLESEKEISTTLPCFFSYFSFNLCELVYNICKSKLDYIHRFAGSWHSWHFSVQFLFFHF